MILRDNVRWGFVAEDDIHICKSSNILFENNNWIPQHCDILKAETTNQRILQSTNPIILSSGHELRELISYHGCAGGYFISNGAANKLLEKTKDTCDPIDHILFNKVFNINRSLHVYQLNPAICIQDMYLNYKPILVSVLDSDRTQSKIEHYGRIRILVKIWKEVSRPIIRLSRYFTYSFRHIQGKNVYKKVPFSML